MTARDCRAPKETRHDPEPAVPGAGIAPDYVAHDHPLPRWVRVLAYVYGLLLFLLVGSVLVSVFQAEAHDAEQRRVIVADIERRSEMRDREQARIEEQLRQQEVEQARRDEVTRLALCDYLDAEPDEPQVLKLAERFSCAFVTTP